LENNPDTGHDPIASRPLPFRGDFVLFGALSAVASLSAYAGYFYSNNTALCAIATQRGQYLLSKNGLGLEVSSSLYRAISARGATIGIETLSDKLALSAFGIDMGIETGSKGIALSAHGKDIGISTYSPTLALSAYGNTLGIEVGSANVGLSSFGDKIGAVLMSNHVALSTNSCGVDGYPTNDPYFGPNYISKNVLNNRTGIFTEEPLSAFHVTGGTYLDGHCTITGNLSVKGDLTKLDTYVLITSSTQIVVNNASNTESALFVSNTGNNRIVEFYDVDSSVTPTRPSFMIDGDTARPGFVGINVGKPNEKLTILGNISAMGNLSATFIHVSPFSGSYTALPDTRAVFHSYVNSYAQVNHQNLFDGAGASADFIATSNNGTDTTGFIDLGINNNNYSQTTFTIVGASDGYLYTQGGNLAVGTGAAKNLVFFTNGTLAANERMRIDSSGNINIGDTISGAGAATLKVKGQTDINITGSAANNIGNSLSTTTVIGPTNINNSGSSNTNIGTSTSTTTVTVGNATGPTTIALNGSITALGTTSINNSGDKNTNIGTSTTATTVTIGNSTGPTTVAINGSTTLLGTTNINNTGTASTAIGNSTGNITQLGANIYLNNNANTNATNIGTGSTSGDIKIGNVTSTTAARVGIGVAPSVRLDVSNNATVPAAASGTVLHVTQSDTTNARVLVDSFGVSSNARPAFTGRAAGGTAASPSAVASDAVLCEFTGQGYGANAYSTTSMGRVTIKAAEAWSNTAQGTYIGFEATTPTTTTTNEIATVKSTGLDVAIGQITHIGNPSGAIPVLTKTTGVNFKAALNTLTTLYTVPAGYRFVPTNVGVIHDTVVFSNLATNSTTVTDTMPLFKLVNSNGSSIFGSNGGWFAPAQNYFSGSLTSQGSHDVYSTVSGPKAVVASNDNVKFKIDTAWASAGVGTHFTTWSGTVILQGFLVAN